MIFKKFKEVRGGVFVRYNDDLRENALTLKKNSKDSSLNFIRILFVVKTVRKIEKWRKILEY